MDHLQEGNGIFALKLLKTLSEDSSNNIFLSPISISAALTMVFMGAKGMTASQMVQTLSLDKCSGNGGGDVHQGFQSLLAEVNKTGTQYLLKTANRLFGEKTCDILASFKDACRKFYEAEMEELDFKGDTEQSRQRINTWVAKKTEDKIKELLAPGIVDPDTVLVLVNAIYFKGNWDKQFNKEHTREKPFKVSKTEEKPVQMMFMKSTFKMTYIGEIFTKILLLPYAGNELNMIIMLPDEHIELKTVEKELTYEKFIEWTRLDMLDEEEVEVFLPRLTIMDPLLKANGNFAIKLFKVLGEDISKNVFFSPPSISSALSMILMGASGTTASQICQSFKDACHKLYVAEIEELDFKGAPEQSRQHINTWVAKKTEDIIRELLPLCTVNSNTCLFLVNVIYFKGSLEKPFNKADTREMPFKVSTNEKKTVQMMSQKSTFKMTYVKDISTQVLTLPFENSILSMYFFVPDIHVAQRKLENELTYDKFLEWTDEDTMEEKEMEVFLPRIKLEESYDMNGVLRKLGMTDAFEEDKADFSGISSKHGLFLSKVVHKSFVEMSEEGTEAAAPTDVVTMKSPLTPRCLIADHPFLFSIQDTRSKEILFLGRFSSP